MNNTAPHASRISVRAQATGRPGNRKRSAPPDLTNAEKPQVRGLDAEVEVPEVGWLWQVGTKQVGTKQQQKSMPSATATVANLKADRIKAKK